LHQEKPSVIKATQGTTEGTTVQHICRDLDNSIQ
jgi:hypothetical protein